MTINILEIKLTKTKESIQNNEITVSLLRKSKQEYYSSLDVKNITDNKTFWKTVKPLLSDKVTSTQKIILIDNDKIVKNDDETARVLNTFFSNIVKDLKIPNYNNSNSLAENIQKPVLKAIVKYRIHPDILTIREVCKKNPQLSLKRVTEILRKTIDQSSYFQTSQKSLNDACFYQISSFIDSYLSKQ